jgi:mannose/cellobiose epimerase-like protein (N-acyl-D-glucosamine 2-epimerase family)
MSDPTYRDPGWLRGRIADVLSFYYPDCLDDRRGGYVAQFDEETGRVYDPDAKHLVATCRFVSNFSLAATLDIDAGAGGEGNWLDAAARGVHFLRDAHRDADSGGYDWLLEGAETVDDRRSCYGHAFVLLAFARATEAGVPDADGFLAETSDLVRRRFFEPERGLFRSELGSDWRPLEAYRGQNANMHMCEAMLVAFEATGEEGHLNGAARIARGITVDLTAETDGRIWEHYADDWRHDFAYNRDRPNDTFRPWGYQPGHHAEWAKLLASLARHRDDEWLLDRAAELFEYAVDAGWDDEFGGFYYALDRDDDPVVTGKYGWPVAEAIGAAAALFERTGDERYAEWYDRLWAYAEANLVNPRFGNWYTKLTRQNERVDTDEGPAVEPGYHPIGACGEGIRAFGRRSES